jgi:hypothetical protein
LDVVFHGLRRIVDVTVQPFLTSSNASRERRWVLHNIVYYVFDIISRIHY